ncbi:hypothetical protein TUM4438_35220 [Shewanella sairae]|uniref:Uncharacterized protein n=1 Tax=Shewanella sairae TaxID=190310 RepID=A0ABQ4PP14_9GAMM|nr:hypothetical protein TUM4438_35220 [Shewanella sairae]
MHIWHIFEKRLNVTLLMTCLFTLHLNQRSGVVMEIQEYEGAYYQLQDEMLESLPVEMDEEAFLD